MHINSACYSLTKTYFYREQLLLTVNKRTVLRTLQTIGTEMSVHADFDKKCLLIHSEYIIMSSCGFFKVADHIC